MGFAYRYASWSPQTESPGIGAAAFTPFLLWGRRDFSLNYLVCQKPPEYLRWRVLWPCSAILIQEKYRRPRWILTS